MPLVLGFLYRPPIFEQQRTLYLEDSVDAPAETLLEQTPLLDQPRQQHPAGNDDRQRLTRAREAAEALFTPKQPLAKTLEIKSPLSAEPSARQPRVLSMSQPPVPRENAEPASRPATGMRPAIPKSEVVRIHTWLKYGMTTAQAAAVYGVAVDEIEQVLRQAEPRSTFGT